jgi:hypothetical protein
MRVNFRALGRVDLIFKIVMMSGFYLPKLVALYFELVLATVTVADCYHNAWHCIASAHPRYLARDTL